MVWTLHFAQLIRVRINSGNLYDSRVFLNCASLTIWWVIRAVHSVQKYSPLELSLRYNAEWEGDEVYWAHGSKAPEKKHIKDNVNLSLQELGKEIENFDSGYCEDLLEMENYDSDVGTESLGGSDDESLSASDDE